MHKVSQLQLFYRFFLQKPFSAGEKGYCFGGGFVKVFFPVASAANPKCETLNYCFFKKNSDLYRDLKQAGRNFAEWKNKACKKY